MSERIREIKFLHFRGLPDYCCALKGKSLAVLAGNGKGKSGIVDGIEFLFAGRVRRFHGEGTGSINPDEAICHIQKKGDPIVELHFSPTDNCARRCLSQASVLQIPNEPTIQSYITSHPTIDAFILRRTQTLEFICDQDATRYRKYIRLLGLTAIDEMQKSFVEAVQTAESELQVAQRSLDFQLSLFRDSDSNLYPGTLAALLVKCSELVQQLGIDDLNGWEKLQPIIEKLEAKRSVETKAKIDTLNKTIASLESQMPDGLASLVTATNIQQTKLRALKAASDEAAAGEIIHEAISFFESHKDISTCPLCEQTLDEGYAATFAKLKQRNAALTELQTAEAKRIQNLNQLITDVQRCADRLAKDLESAPLFAKEDVKVIRDTRASTLRWLRLLRRLIKERCLEEILFPKSMETIGAVRQKLQTDAITRRNTLIPPDAAKLETTVAFLKKAKSSWANIKVAETKITELSTKRNTANQASDAFYQAREKAIQKIFDQIANKVLQYYKKLHDIDGDLEKSECTSLILKPTSRAQAGGLKLAIQFLGLADSCDPRTFLSEGHLDSLGLCLYLATVRTFNPPGTMLVLDDILTSIDKDHRHRVAELLLEQFSDFQLVLTTHDEHWFNILQTMAQARGDQGNWIFKRITRWTVEKGPESAAFESTWSYIEANLNENSYRELGGPLRVVLEDFLKRVAEKLELKIRYRFDGKYTSGDFTLAGIQNEIRDKLIVKCPTEDANIRQDVGRVFGTGNLINFLSHDNPGRLEVTLPQARDFVAGIKALTKRCQDNQIIKGIGS